MEIKHEGSNEAHDALAKLFYSDDILDEISWEEITIQVKQLFKDCSETVNEFDKTKNFLETVEQRLQRLSQEYEDLKQDKEKLEIEAERQQGAALELLRDLGFDTSRLLVNEKLDFSNPDVLHNLSKQMKYLSNI